MTKRRTKTDAKAAAPRVLYVCHNHASIRPGGVETYALELFDAVRASGLFDPILLAQARRPDAPTPIAPVPGQEGQYFFHVDHAEYDALYGTAQDKSILTRDFDAFLREHRPDIVHFQHTLFLGYDLIRQVRNTLPDVPIVYTLHEYLPICHHNGQMVRTRDLEPCDQASPNRCHECFPDVSPEAFFLRKRFIESHFRLVDLFIAPSRFLRDRYIEWGIPAAKIQQEEYGRRAPARRAAPAADAAREGPRNRFGFFGQFSAFKGVDLLLRAMKLLDCEATLSMHGANLEFQSKSFQREFHALVEDTPSVSLIGAYEQSAIPRLMADVDWVVVPSIWWENSPLVIQEAFLHRRPVICSDIGGMAEKVTAGVNGLHFRAGDAQSLANVLTRAATQPRVWGQLRDGIRKVHRINAHMKKIAGTYQSLLEAAKA